jgi:phosphate uptake regulator
MVYRHMYRRLQLTGGKTFSINLPIKWIKEQGLDRDSNLLITELDNGSLLISPKSTKKELPPRFMEVFTSDSPGLSRDITRSYLLGYDQVIIKTKDAKGFTRDDLDLIETLRARLPGAEIIREGKNEILVEIIADTEKNDPDKLIRRIFNLTQDMIERIWNIINPEKKIDEASIEEDLNRIKDMDQKVNRTYFLIVRQLRALIQDSELRNNLKITTLKIMDLRIISHLLENIGDNCVFICDRLLDLQNLIKPLINDSYHKDRINGKTDVIYEALITIAEQVKKYHQKTFDSFIKKDNIAAAQIIQDTISFKVDRNKYMEDFKTSPSKGELAIIMHRFFDIFEMLIDICDLIQPEEKYVDQ